MSEPSSTRTVPSAAAARAFGAAGAGCWACRLAGLVAALLAVGPGAALRGQAPLRSSGQNVERLPAVADGEASLASFEADALHDPALRVAVGGEPPADGKKLSNLEKKFEELARKFKAFSDAAANKEETYPNFKMTGFLQLDTANFSQDALNQATIGNAQNGVGFRRARLAVTGKVAEFTAYQMEMDFATAGRPSFFDTYLEQSNIPWLGAVRVGQFCQPFSVDSLTGFRYLTFLERDLAFLTFVPFRRVGIMCSDQSEDQMTAWAYSLYRTGGFNDAPLGDDRFATDLGDLGSYSFSGRLTHLVWYDEPAEDRYLWHLGGGYNYSHLGANTSLFPAASASGTPGNAGGGPAPFYQARTLPEFGPLGYSELGSVFGVATNATPVFVDSGRYEATGFHLFGVESIHQWGALGTQSEMMLNLVNTPFGSVLYHGGYVQAAYRLTGEHRTYDKKLGTLTWLVPFTDFISIRRGRGGRIHGWGAWEAAARWSYVDVRNPTFLDGHYYVPATNTFTGTNKLGNGYLQNTTLGLTWFLNMHTKVQFNWIHSMLSNTAFGASTADLFVTRAHLDF